MNIQNLPRKEKVVKKAFIPKLDYLVFPDYSQIEMRVLAYYMAMLGDSSMVDVLADSSTDLHTESAKGIFQFDREPTDPERQLGKNMNFSMVYGGGKPAVMRYLREYNSEVGREAVPVTFKYAGIVLDRFHSRWPGIKLVVRELEAAMERQGYVRTIAGARLHPPKPHVQLNAVVQSSAAEFTRRALRYAYKGLREADCKSHLVVTVHDEIGFDTAADELDFVIRSAPIWMDCFPEVSAIVPIPVEIEITSTSWADKEPI